MDRPSSGNSLHLEPPRKSIELLDPGARELESSDGEDEYFSDASEGRRKSRPVTPVSPIPRTRVEMIDDAPSYGQVPGSAAYEKRLQDAVPDEVEVVPEGRLSKRASMISLEPPRSPGGTLIPLTVVEKVDPSSPSFGDVPGTEAYIKRMADASPDVILKAPEPGQNRTSLDELRPAFHQPQVPIPELITPVDSSPDYDELGRPTAPKKRLNHPHLDSSPSFEGDVAGSPTLDRSVNPIRRRSMRNTNDDLDDNDEAGMGDDFDDFEEGTQGGADDEFGDFDDGFQDDEDDEDDDEALTPTAPRHQESEEPIPSFPLLDSEAFSSLRSLIGATNLHLDAIFPNTTSEKISSLPEPEDIPADSPIFPSDRSRSLWKQLITPPPVQPPNWTKSRIRRLFLVSLGVPVDLDEILPPSKQKKLVLPDINLEPSSPRKSESDKALGSVARLKAQAGNDSTGSVDSTQSATKPSKRRPRGPPPPPELDLGAVKRLCATTNEKLDGLTDEELQGHVEELQALTEKTSELLEYWLKRRDGALKEKEAFEGVIENLVKHARRVRK